MAHFWITDCLNSGTERPYSRAFCDELHNRILIRITPPYGVDLPPDSFFEATQSSVRSGAAATPDAGEVLPGRTTDGARGSLGARPARTVPRPAALAA